MGPCYEMAQNPHLLRQHEAGLVTDLDRHSRAPRGDDSDQAILPMLVVLLVMIVVGLLAGRAPAPDPQPVEVATVSDYSSRP